MALASFFSDAGHEIATSLLPAFITAVLHGSAAALGLLEGLSDALVGVAKLIGGPLADEPDRRRRMATGGYLVTAGATAAIGLASAVWQAAVLRSLAWAARGLRSPARDAMLSELAPAGAYGRAFGLERAGDNLGAVVGPLAAAALVAALGIRPAIWCAAVPGALAAVAITVAARESRRRAGNGRRTPHRRLHDLRHSSLAGPLVPIALFECGNVAVTLLILRSGQLLHHAGRNAAAAASLTLVLYAAHNALGAGVAYAGGHWIDRIGPRRVFIAGVGLFACAYTLFGLGPPTWWGMLAAFALAGAAIGLAETSQSALVAARVPDGLRGTAFGILGGVQAAGDVAATVVAGALYVAISPAAAFAYAASWMIASVAALMHAGGRWGRAGYARNER